MLKIQLKNLNYVTKVEKVTNDVATDLELKINSTFDSYVAALEARRTKLLAESDHKSSIKRKRLWSERDCLERTIADMTTTLRFTKRVRKCKDNKEFLLSSPALPCLRKFENWDWNDETVEDIECYCLDFQQPDLAVDGTGRLKEEKLPRYKIDFEEFNAVAALGKEHTFTIHVTKGRRCRTWTCIETPSVTLRHIQSETCDVADISVTHADDTQLLEPESVYSMDNEESQKISYTWRVTYTPYCGGCHTLMIEFDDMTTKREITVCGVPSIGSQVMRGPLTVLLME